MYCNTYLLNTDIFDNDQLFAKYYQHVSKERKHKIDNLRNREDKNNSLAVYVLATKLLKENKLKEEDLYFENNRPLIKENKAYISFSHSGNYALVCLADDKVGCDIQKFSLNDYTKIAEKYFDEDEKKEMADFNDPEYAFYQIWSRKECLIKAYGFKNIKEINYNEINEGYVFYIEDTENDIGYSVVIYCHGDCDYQYKEIDFENYKEII